MPIMMLKSEFPTVWAQSQYTLESLTFKNQLTEIIGETDEGKFCIRWWDPEVCLVLLLLAKIARAISWKAGSLQTFSLYRNEISSIPIDQWTEDYDQCHNFLLPSSMICAFHEALCWIFSKSFGAKQHCSARKRVDL
jgi:hypothetical protein